MVFLIHESQSILVAALRDIMHPEISEPLHKHATTMIYVAYNQVKAMTKADEIVV